MADPQHVPTLDGFDRTTVRLYRLGLTTVTFGLLCMGVGGVVVADETRDAVIVVGRLIVTIGAALALADLHLYDRRVRWAVGALGWTGVVLQIVASALPAAAAHVVLHAGLGFVFAAISGLALKERFCFRVPGLNLVPLLLAASLVPLLAGWSAPAGLLLGAAGGILAMLVTVKLRQPLGHDIGDKSKYQS